MPQTRWLVFFRISLFIILLFGLLQPQITRRFIEKKPLKWNVYIDNSTSIGYHQIHSLAALNAGIKETLEDLENRDVLLDYYHFGGVVTPIERGTIITATEASTDLGNVLVHARQDQQNDLAGIIMFTDGQPTQGLDPLQVAKNLTIPVYIVGIGDTIPLVDVAIQSIDVPTVAIKGEVVEATVTITASGTLEERLNVTLFQKKKILGSRFVRVSGDGALTSARFRFKPETLGKTTYRVQVSSVEDEINILNNRQSFTLTVLKDRYRIALLTGAPNFNTPVIKRILIAQPRVQLDHFVQYGRTFRPAIKSFWETPYDLIVFDNFPVQSLSKQWQRIFAKKLVAQKSALAWIVGPNITVETAATLFPFFYVKDIGEVLEKDIAYSWNFTDKVRDLPLPADGGVRLSNIDQSELPPVTLGLQLEGMPEETRVIARLTASVDVPLLLIGEKGSLRSALWTTPDLHQVYYKLTGSENSELVYDLWTGLVTWLMRTSGDNDMYFRLDKDLYQQGELITVTGNRIGEDSPLSQAAMTIYRDSLIVNSTELRYNPERRRWEGQLWASVPGEYEYEINFNNGITTSRQTGSFRVSESQIELNKVFLNRNLLSRIAEQTGGKYFSWASRAELKEYVGPRTVTETIVNKRKLTETWWVLGLILALLTAEWALRRKNGLP
ncbi:MAG: hypothetical protein GXO92_04830 [FCB group bacterium]|nr:hypothetical protein [FCB group bacterium]